MAMAQAALGGDMARRLFLHIGSFKTGTTAIQHGLLRHQARLARQGISYVTDAGLPNLHRQFVIAPGRRFLTEGFYPADPAGLARTLSDAPGDIVIGSSERMFLCFDPSRIATLAAALRPCFDEVRILCYLRRQDRHANALLLESAKAPTPHLMALCGTGTAALPPVTPLQDLYLDYHRKMGLWADAFGEAALTIRVYDRAALAKGDSLANFLGLLGRPGLRLPGKPETNPTLSAAQGRMGQMLNAFSRDPQLRRRIFAQLEQDGRLQPDQAAARAFYEPYRERNRLLNARFRISDVPDLFNDDVSDLPETAIGWTGAGTEAALRAVLSELQRALGDRIAPPPRRTLLQRGADLWRGRSMPADKQEQ